MEIFTIEHLTFSYASYDILALDDFSLNISKGEFIVLCGKSGCGKSTLLRHLKSELAPHGKRSGQIFFKGEPLENIDSRTQAAKIGYIFQSPDNQIVTDKVWHELAFGLESLGAPQQEIRLKVAEMASFFGIEGWFHKNVTELSGGQKQILNLASVMAMQPDILILDEPTSQLDPIAAAEFLAIIAKINRDLGVSIIISEHRLEEVIPLADRIIVMDNGKTQASGRAVEVGEFLRNSNHEMFIAMPVPMQVYACIDSELSCPVSIRDGRKFLDDLSSSGRKPKDIESKAYNTAQSEPSIELRDIYFRYEKESPDVLKGLNFKAYPGELSAILGGNGTGKTTALSIISGLRKVYRGTALINGKNVNQNKFNISIGVLPQNPQNLFVAKTVAEDLKEIFGNNFNESSQKKLDYIIELCELQGLLNRHPYDLSGGEAQRAALAKILLLEPEILLLDEPTKGLDAHFKIQLADILYNLKKSGKTIIMVSHDIEFCAAFADKCALFFDGGIVSENIPSAFFKNNSFYTTAASRMAKEHVPSAITANDIIEAFGGKIQKNISAHTEFPSEKNNQKTIEEIKIPAEKPVSAQPLAHTISLSKRTIAAAFMIILCIPVTIYFGIYHLNDRKYYFISMLVILETMLPFFMVFEGRKPKARELIIISVLCVIGVCGRMAFFWVPQFKPVIAVVIISGIAFGGETGFLVGAVTGFVSNYFFGQGPWTPWQMFAFGIIGFLAGLLFSKSLLPRKKYALCIFGGLAAFFIYGIIMNTHTVLTMEAKISAQAVLLACLRGVPFDLIHGVSSAIFLYFLAEPMLEKLDRIKEKYGLVA